MGAIPLKPAPPSAPSIDAPAADREFKLTVPQVAIWLDQALHPGKPIYNTGQTIAIGAELDPGRFRDAVAHAVAVTDALRLRFTQRADGIFQSVVDTVATKVEFRDFS